jgi:hypothetical protein
MAKPIAYYLSKKSTIDLHKLEQLTVTHKAELARKLAGFLWARSLKGGGHPGSPLICQVSKALGIPAGEVDDMPSSEIARMAAALLLAAADTIDRPLSGNSPSQITDPGLMHSDLF